MPDDDLADILATIRSSRPASIRECTGPRHGDSNAAIFAASAAAAINPDRGEKSLMPSAELGRKGGHASSTHLRTYSTWPLTVVPGTYLQSCGIRQTRLPSQGWGTNPAQSPVEALPALENRHAALATLRDDLVDDSPVDVR